MGYPKKCDGLLRQGEQVRFGFIRTEKANHTVTVLCRVLEVTRSGRYAFAQRRPSARQRANAALVVRIHRAHERSRRTYGSPRVHRELQAKGESVGRHRVGRLMREHGIQAPRKRRICRTTDSRHRLRVAANVLDRRFGADAPDRAWVTDTTYVPTDEGWLYVAPILDLFSRRVVGLAMSDRLDRQLPLEALGEALRLRRPGRGLLHVRGHYISTGPPSLRLSSPLSTTNSLTPNTSATRQP